MTAQFNRYLKLFPLAMLLLLTGCPPEDDEEDVVKPVKITVGVAVAEPATPAAPAIEPAVAYDGTRVHMVYCQDNSSGRRDIMYVQRVGGGAYTTPAPVFAASTVDSRTPAVCLDSTGTLHMVWAEGTTPNRDIYYATRTAGGVLSTPANLTVTADDEANPRVTVDSTGRVHVVWEGSTPPPSPTTAVFYRRTQGGIFVAATVLPKANGAQPAEMPDITVDEANRVYVVWSEQTGTARNIRMLRSDDNGANFGSTGNGFAFHGGVDLTQPRVRAGEDGTVFFTFIGQESGGDRGVYASYTRTGYTPASPTLLASSKTGGLRDPEIAVFQRTDDSYTIAIACNDGTGTGGEVIVFASHNDGVNYGKDPTILSQGNTQPTTNRGPAIAMDDNELVVCWEAQPPGGGVVRTWTSASTYEIPKKKKK